VSGVVLLLEDNPTDVFVIREIIEQCGPGLALHVASDGQQALQFLQALDRDRSFPCPVLLLLDLNVPKVDGLDVLSAFRRHSRCKRTPVIVVTSSTAERDRAAAEGLGADAYFQKPQDLAAYMKLAPLITQILRTTERSGS
jgi:CheY-like chemotaxis protein